MKLILPIFTCLLLHTICYSQSTEKNLKLVNFFSRDTVVSMSTNPVFTVPPGKIWKVENIICGPSCSVLINDIQIIRTGTTSGFYTSATFNIPSIWLNAGERISYNYFLGALPLSRFRFSVFEFILE